MATWRELIAIETNLQDDGGIIYCTLSESELDVEFNDRDGVVRGKPFTAWSEERVYFPVCYDGHESVGSVPRNPCDQPTYHVGG